ncbi:MAG: UDP-GlcNAc:undecaprenyl-phosphate/decaprenyl-phosphate GlcNAc-phosphate transferase [Eubacteriales bacterium]|nr:UDP-GlcNAc:undecaprenyl-phosphate/decaprenyl-phosphate GlcNAc-phosphate transferase [Eubacteriales bacterium]
MKERFLAAEFWLLLPVVALVTYSFAVFLSNHPLSSRSLDYPDWRKIHRQPVPRVGGVAVCLAFWIFFLYYYGWRLSPAWQGLFAGAGSVFVLGLIDDHFRLSPWIKLLAQIGAAVLAWFMGLRVTTITGLAGGVVNLEFWSLPVTILWLVAVTNAINLIDGLDGLAAGTALVALLTIGASAWFGGREQVTGPALLLAAVLAGFLPRNFYPARIFLGDCGSYFLGFMVAGLAVIGLGKRATLISLLSPVVVLGIPIFDTLFAVFRRLRTGKPVFAPDNSHLHHLILRQGLSHPRAVVIIYILNLFLALCAVTLTVLSLTRALFLCGFVFASLLFLGMKLEKATAGKGKMGQETGTFC